MLNRLYAALLTSAGLPFGDYITLDEAVTGRDNPPRTGIDPKPGDGTGGHSGLEAKRAGAAGTTRPLL